MTCKKCPRYEACKKIVATGELPAKPDTEPNCKLYDESRKNNLILKGFNIGGKNEKQNC